MKKLLVLTLMAVLASASMALAAVTLTNHVAAVGGTPAGPYHTASETGAAAGAGPFNIGSTPFAVSTNVTLMADGAAGGFNVSAKHVSGDLSFISSSTTATITEDSTTYPKGTAMSAIILGSGTNLYTGAY